MTKLYSVDYYFLSEIQREFNLAKGKNETLPEVSQPNFINCRQAVASSLSALLFKLYS